MGSSESSEQRTEEKMVDATGQINNNIIIQEAKDTHIQMLLNEKLLMASYILIGFETIKLIVYCYTQYQIKMKKKYAKKNAKPTV